MMKINAEFSSIEDMEEFANFVKGRVNRQRDDYENGIISDLRSDLHKTKVILTKTKVNLAKAIKKLKEKGDLTSELDDLIEDTELSKRVINALVADGIVTIGDLVQKPLYYLEHRIEGIAKSGFEEIVQMMEKRNLTILEK